MINQCKLLGSELAVVAVLFCVPLQAADGVQAVGAEVDEATRVSAPVTPREQRTLASVPNGVDTYTAFISGSALGAAGVGLVDSRPGDDGTETSGGIRIWGTFLDRIVAQGEVGNDSKGRFAPSLAVAVRALGGKQEGWAAGVLGRYRTEGLSTIEGEIEGGLLGSYARRKLHLDANLIVGVGIEEEEADGEVLLRFGYDVMPMFRLGLESRVRRELAEEAEAEAEAAGVEGGEWDAFAGAQGALAFGQFFGRITAGPQKPRFSEKLGWMAQVALGGVAF